MAIPTATSNDTNSAKSADPILDPFEDYERVLLVKPTVYVYRIPPLMSVSRGFKASDWNLPEPDWTGRLRLISKADKCFLRIEDSATGDLYCQAPVLAYPGPQVQPVVDSRRYFVVKVVSDTGRTALIGIGFADGADSFDLNVALQDYFSASDNSNKLLNENEPKLDLALKEDTKINISIGGLKPASEANRAARAKRSENNANLLANSDPSKPFILPPPPSASSRRK